MRPPVAPLALLLALACSGDEQSTAPAVAHDAISSAEAPPPAAAPAPPMPERRESVMLAKRGSFAMDSAATAGGGMQAGGDAAAPRMLIRSGNATVEARDVDAAVGRARQLAASLGGHVAGSSTEGGRDQVRRATLELKIPADRFDQAIARLRDLGRVESVNVGAQDVGEEYVDVRARVANAKRLEERLVALLATRTGRLDDVLAVERELARVREEIERHEGRMRYLESRAATSTLVLSVHEPFPVLGSSDNPIAEAFREAWRNFVGMVAWLIAASGVLVPVAAVVAGGVVLWRRRAAV